MLTIILSPVFNAVIPPGRNSHSSDPPASTDSPWSSNPAAAVSLAGNDSSATALQLEFAQQEGTTPHQDSCSQLHHRQEETTPHQDSCKKNSGSVAVVGLEE